MRLAGRAAATGVAALVVGLVASFVAAAMLRSATPEAGLLWRVAQASDVAIWTLAGAHGAPLRVEAGVEVDERVAEIGEEIGDRIGDIFGREDVVPEVPDSPAADLRIRFASLTILGLVGAALVLGSMRAGARSLPDALVTSTIAAGVYALGLALLATTAGVSRGVDLRIASASASVGVGVAATLVLGLLWAFVFALLGALRAPGVVGQMPPMLRAVGRGMSRAAVFGSAAAVVCLIVLAVSRGGGGGPGLSRDLLGVGIVLLAVNVVAAGVVLAHGAAMSVTLDAGPLEGFTQIGYSPQGASLPATRWLFLVVPLVAGLAAGRAMRGRTTRPAIAALAFGAAWGIALAVVAAMLRVEALSNFSIGSLEAGGGLRVGVLETAFFGFLWGTVTSYLGLVLPFGEEDGRIPSTGLPKPEAGVASVPQPAIGEPSPPQPRVELPKELPGRCGTCGAEVPTGDSFCAACGAAVRAP